MGALAVQACSQAADLVISEGEDNRPLEVSKAKIIDANV